MIIFDPEKILRKIAPKSKIEKLLKSDLKIKKTALSFVKDIDGIDPKAVARTALKVARNYRDRVKAETAEKGDLRADPKLLIHRVQDTVIFEISQSIKGQYRGESYVWLPSDAEEPDPEHQLNYGKTFQIDEGEIPGERYGCRCGMQILVPDSTLKFD